MTALVSIKRNDVFTDSMVIAEGTGNNHHSVTRLIRRFENQLNQLGKLGFKIQPSASGQGIKIYELNEPQATFLITLLRNTGAVVAFKLRLTTEFYMMRQMLLQKQTLDWQETRRAGKITRREETDVISELIEYAKAQGSRNSKELYRVYSKLANKIAGVNNRELASITQINNLSLIEHIILHVIRSGMQQGKHYKAIYQDSKMRLEQFSDIACLPQLQEHTGTEEVSPCSSY
ncbi:MAG TPA: hypothetical protein DER33_10025 [Syntrophomonas sp.]|jgi:phage regulator Rha-like protein|nr:hypothetical protein [Syntrophomonas sp.]